jgi:hypothetical protein
MARRYRSRGSYGGGYRSAYYGRERALQHIEEARQLSVELGGTDEDVKQYFFLLPPAELAHVLADYGARHGEQARAYATEAIPKWRDGRVKMSGMVATRLFRLLPPRMPLQEKYRLTTNLWRHVGPSSHRVLRVGLDAELSDVLGKVHSHITDVVVHYTIPDGLARRFEWLSAGDIQVKQQLLNHVREMEKSLVVEGARAQLPVMLEHMRGNEEITHRMAQVLQIGKHKLELLVDKASTGATLEDPSIVSRVSAVTSPTSSSGSGWGWIILVAVGIAVLLMLGK